MIAIGWNFGVLVKNPDVTTETQWETNKGLVLLALILQVF